MEITDDTMVGAENTLARLDAFARRTDALDGKPSEDGLTRFAEIMDDDLDTPGAADLMFRLVREANTALDNGDEDSAATAAATARVIAATLGIELRGGTEVPAEMQALADERHQARQAKDWARADELRDQLSDAGWAVEDSADGPVLRPLG